MSITPHPGKCGFMLSRTDGEGWRDCSRTCVHVLRRRSLSRRCQVLRRVRIPTFCAGEPRRVQTGDGVVRRRGGLDGLRGRIGRGAAARDHDRTGRASAAVVQRYGGTVDKFTGDGIMAVFGAPIALRTTLSVHAWRRWTSRTRPKRSRPRLTVRRGTLKLRVGLNSGQVIVGEIGSGNLGYTAIGEQVGMAQRMESVAPPGGVMLSESTGGLSTMRWSLASDRWCASRAPTRWSLLSGCCESAHRSAGDPYRASSVVVGR